ncbi:MAG: hypothetical protein NTY84_10425, partial [Verrucomicrobia bacterium]|nr:hypothetical protein [Verrucomicrobiota bacterium]
KAYNRSKPRQTGLKKQFRAVNSFGNNPGRRLKWRLLVPYRHSIRPLFPKFSEELPAREA